MVSARDTETNPTSSAPPDAYAGTTRWVSPQHPVGLCDYPPFTTGSRGKCTPVPANSAMAIGEPIHHTTNLGIDIHDGYRATDAKGNTGYITSTDPILMMGEAEKKTADAERATCDRKGGVSIGMSKEQVYASCWGRPRKVNETITAGGRHEQWVYGGGYVYLTNGTVTSIQTSR
jgi:hypothetical protein